MPEQQRLNTSQSAGGLSTQSRLSEARKEKLLNLKKREDLKDALTTKFQSRFGKGARKADDEMSVCTNDIRGEVDQFAELADVTEANLARLERRIQSKATREPDAQSVSAYSAMSRRSRSVASLAGENMMKKKGGSFDWSRLDEYASYLHEQDAMRQKQGVQALQRKLRKDLDIQVAERKAKQDENQEEERRYHNNLMVELERWKHTEKARAEELRQKLQREKKDRDEQLEYERHLKNTAETKKKEEEAKLVDKIVTEMEAEQIRFERKKEQEKAAMRKVFEENVEDLKKRKEQVKEQQERDAAAMREYNRILDEQEEQRAAELGNRMARQKELMDKLQGNVDKQKQEAGDNDAMRAAKQQEEMDRHYAEAERVKQSRLKQLKMETQAYLFKQMAEKDGRGAEEKELQDIQAAILERDTQEYNEIEREKLINKKIRAYEHRKEIEAQIYQRSLQRVPEMSEAEVKMNRQLLNLVNKTLTVRDQREADALAEAQANGEN